MSQRGSQKVSYNRGLIAYSQSGGSKSGQSQRLNAGVRYKASDKDHLIALLRKQLDNINNKIPDYTGPEQEVFAMGNKYKLLNDAKMKSQMEGEARLQ